MIVFVTLSYNFFFIFLVLLVLLVFLTTELSR